MSHLRPSTCIAAAIGALFCAAPAAGGGDPAPAPPQSETGRATFTLAPLISLTDVGVDSNILASSTNPRRDTTGRVTIGAEPTSHLGRVDLSGRATVGFAYFRQYSDQRSVDTDDMGRIDVRLNRVTLYGSGSVLRTRDVFSPEIDIRTQRLEQGVEAGTEIQVTPHARLAVGVRRSYLQFDSSSDLFFNASLQTALDRRVDTVTVSARDAITPLTTIAVIGDLQRDAFAFTSARNTDSVRVLTGIECKPTALLDGKAYAGYRIFHPTDTGAPDLQAVVASVDMGYTVVEAVRLGVRFTRDLAHSYSLGERYFVLNDVRGSITSRITPSWDVTAMVGRQYLTYQTPWMSGGDQPGVDSVIPIDRLVRFGVGTTARLGPRYTFSVNGETYRRDSTLTGGVYDRVRVVSALAVRF